MHMAYYGGHGGQLHMAETYFFLQQRGSKQEGTSKKSFYIYACTNTHTKKGRFPSQR